MIDLPFLPTAHPAFPIASLPEIPSHWQIECPPVAHDGTPMSIEEALISDGIDAEAERSRA